MSKARTLLPRTVVQVFSETIYDYYTYILDNFVLPAWIYHFVRIYITFSTCLLFTNFHQYGTGIKPLEVFLNLYATDLTEKWATINFVIDMIVFIAIYTSIGYFSIVFTKKSHLSKTSTYVNVFCVEVIFPLLLLVTASQIGNNVGLIYKNMENYLMWVYTILLLFLLITTLLFHNFFLCSYIPFVPGRTFTLSASLQGFDMNVIISVRVFARCANALNGTIYAIGFRIAIALVLLFGIFIIIYYNVYNNRGYSGFICATFCAGFVLDVISIFTSLDWVIRLLIFTGVIIIGNTAIYNYLKASSKKAKEIYDALEQEELDFDDVYPKLNEQFLKHCYEAFKMGHPYFFTFKPIVNGAHHEYTNKKIWKFYLRVLAIYNNKIYDLMNASQAFKRLGYNDLQSRLFIRGIDHIIDIRSRKVTKQCKNIMRNIQSHTRTLRTTLVRYWQAIENDEPGTTYAYGSSAQNQMDEIDRMYESVLTKWPNCAPLFKHYAKFLKTVCFNKLKGEQYNALASIKRNIDILEIRAKRCFPLIPLQVESDNLFQPNPQPQQPSNDQASLLSTGSVSNSNELEQNEEQEAELVAQNTLYEMGRHARVPVNTVINVFVVVAFLFVFIMGVILADVIILKKYYIYETLLRFLSCFTSVLFYTSRPVYRICSLVTDALGISYDLQKTTEILGLNEPVDLDTHKQILSDISSLNEYVIQLSQLRPDTMRYIGNVSYALAALLVPYNFLYRTTTDQINDKKEFINFQSALNLQVGSIATYHKDYAKNPEAVIHSQDFMYMLENNYRISGAIHPITKLITHHMLEYTDEISKVALEIAIIFGCISLIIIPIVVILLKIQSNEYGQIVHALHKIPTIVIIQHISELTMKNSEKDKTEKFESALHIQDTHGIPSFLLGIISIICVIAFIIVSFVNFYILTKSKDKFQVLPYQLMNGAMMASNIYDQMAVAKRIWAVNANKGLNADTSFLATKVWPRTTKRILKYVDNSLFGSIDNISYGYLLAKSASRSLFFEKVPEATTNTLHHMFLKFGFIFSMEADVSEMRYFSEFTRDSSVFNKDNERLLNMIHYNDIHLTSRILDKLLNNTFTDIDTDITEQKSLAVLTPIIGLVALGILISVFIYYQMQILRTFRFTIMSLSMLDQKFIQSNERLLDIAAGNFSSDSQSNSIPMHYIDCLKDSTVDSVIITNKHFDILESNHAAKSLSSAAANAKNIEDIIGLPEEVKKVADSSTPTSLSFKKTLKSDSGQSYEMDISCTLCSDESIMIIMHRDLVGEQLDEDRRKTEKKLKDILNRIVPHDFREMFGDNPFKTVSFDNVLLFAVRSTNITFSAEESDESFQVVLQKMKKFNEIVYKASKNSDDCAIVKKHNMAIIMCYNLKTQKRTMQQPLAQAIEALQEIRNECDKQEIKIAAVTVFSRQSLIGIASLNKANFNIFAPEIPVLLKGLSTAGDDELLLSKVDRDIPQNMRDKVRQSEDFLVINIHDC